MLNGTIQTVERDALRHYPVQSAELERSSHGKLVAIHGQPVAGGWLVAVRALHLFHSAIIWVCFTRFLPLTADSRRTKATGAGSNSGFSDVPQWDIRALDNFMLS